MKTDLYNIAGEKTGQITLPKSVFEVTVSPRLIAQAIRVYLNNQRSAHAKTKHRGEVAGTTKKMWSQKGTGRARHGSAKAPIFVGGGSAHGPRGDKFPRMSIGKTANTQAIKAVLSQFAKSDSMVAIDKIGTISPKTKEALALISKIKSQAKVLSSSKKIAIVTSKSLENVKRAFGNIDGLTLLSLSSLNVYNLSNQNYLIFSQGAIKKLAK